MTERKDDRLWGGRFEREPNKQFDAFQRSFAFDRRLLAYEIAVDRAWAKALEPIGIFTAAEVRQTLAALDKIVMQRDYPTAVSLTMVRSSAAASSMSGRIGAALSCNSSARQARRERLYRKFQRQVPR